jgi:hypothetical protein
VPAAARAPRARSVYREQVMETGRFGTEVVVIEPTAADHAAMGRNWMSPARRQPVIDTAERTVLAQLRAPGLPELLRDLPAGEPQKIRRPDGPPSSWPALQQPGRRAA